MASIFLWITIVFALAISAWWVYLLIVKETKKEKTCDLVTTLLSTLLAVFLPVTIGFWILENQELAQRNEDIARYRLLVQAELSSAYKALQTAADRRVDFQSGSSCSGLAFYLQSTMIEEAAKSGLFPFEATADLDTTAASMKLFNIIARAFIEGDVASMPEHIVNVKAKDMEDIRKMLLNDIELLGKELNIDWTKRPEAPTK